MVVNCFYDDEMMDADIIYVPDEFCEIECLQEEFFSWIFGDENNSYWTMINGTKVCNYDVQAFVDWINIVKAPNNENKSYILEKNASKWNKGESELHF